MLLVKNIGQLLTISGDAAARREKDMSYLGAVENAAVLIHKETILAAGTQSFVCSIPEANGADEYDAGGCAVFPAFCDSHTHPIFARARQDEYELRIRGASYQQIAQMGGGIAGSVRHLREVDESELLERGLRHAELFCQYGTGAIEAKSGYGLSLEDEMKMLRVIKKVAEQSPLDVVATFLGAHEIPGEYKNDRESYIKLICETMIPQVADEGLAQYCDVFCESHVFTLEESKKILKAGQARGLKSRVHADQLSLSGGSKLGVELKAVSVDHVDRIGDEEIKALAGSDVIATLLPGSVMHLGLHDYAPARKMIDAGVAVALATDFNPGSAPSLNMQMTMSLACNYMRMTPAESLIAATHSGACAVEMQDRLGSIEPGKQADLFISSVSDYRLIPYHFGMNHCRALIKKGKIV
jgi:imidazolonepropionase